MSKKQAPTFSQLSYIVTGILAAHVQRGDELSQTVIEKAVFAAKTAAEAIEDIVNEYTDDDEQEEEKPFIDEFAKFPWGNTAHTYTELEKWYQQNVKRSKRAFGKSYHVAILNGHLIKDEKTGKYTHGNK